MVTRAHSRRSPQLLEAFSGPTHDTGTQPLWKQKRSPGNSPSHLPRCVTKTRSTHILNRARKETWFWPTCPPGRFRGTKLPSFPGAESGSRKRKGPVCCVQSRGAADDAYPTSGGTGPRRGQSVAGLCPGWPNPKCATPHSQTLKQPDTGLALQKPALPPLAREGGAGPGAAVGTQPLPESRPTVLLLPRRVARRTVSKAGTRNRAMVRSSPQVPPQDPHSWGLSPFVQLALLSLLLSEPQAGDSPNLQLRPRPKGGGEMSPQSLTGGPQCPPPGLLPLFPLPGLAPGPPWRPRCLLP